MEILIVDKDPVNRLVTSALLNNFGCMPTCPKNENTAVDIVLRTPFDLILMEIDDFEVEAFAIARAVRNSGGPNALTPIVGLTGFPADHPDVKDGCDMDGYLKKPYEFMELMDIITKISASENTPRLTAGIKGWWWNMGSILQENRKSDVAGMRQTGATLRT